MAALVAEIKSRHGHLHHKRFAHRMGPVVMPSKKAAKQLLQAVLKVSPLRTLLAPDFTELLLGALDGHPLRDEKLEHGCVGFEVRINPPAFRPEDRGFWVIPEPPAEPVSFSYPNCLRGRTAEADTMQSRLAAACRRAIVPSQSAFKRARVGTFCPGGCGDCLTLHSAQVHHVMPKFRDIVAAFEAVHGMPPEAAMKRRSTYGWEFADPEDAGYFLKFHDARAEVRQVLCEDCHVRAGHAS